MERKTNQRGLHRNNRHPSRIMKALSLFLLVGICGVTANTYSQSKGIHLNVKNTCVKDVFTKIEEQSSYLFLLSENIENKLNKKIDVTINSESLEEVLELIVAHANLQYEVVDKQVVIYNKQSAPENRSSDAEEVEAAPDQQPEKRTISGMVTDKKDGLPVIGANVVVVEDKTGTITDEKGRFSLPIPTEATLRVSFIGYVTREVKITNQTTLIIQLEEDAAQIEEVVVTGIMVRKAENFTGSTQSYSGEQLQNIGNQNLFESLKNLDASMVVLDNFDLGSNPNTLPELQLRGTSTFDFADEAQALNLKGNY